MNRILVDPYNVSNIQVIVVGEKSSIRSRPLLKTILSNSMIKVDQLNATITKSFTEVEELQIAFNQELAQIFQGRKLFPGEIGCANSHNSARMQIAKSEIGGIIFEDDARIINLDHLLQLSLKFLTDNLGKSAILSLAGWNPIKLTRIKLPEPEVLENQKLIKLFGVPPLAVGYALTPKAADSLLQSNLPIHSVADWPFSDCQFFVSRQNLVFHGDEFTQSVIDPSGINSRIRSNFRSRLRFFFFIEFYNTNKRQITFMEYFNKVWLRKFYYYLDFVKVRLLG